MITRPHRYLTRMVIFLLVVSGICAVLFPRLQDAFTANSVLNGVILGVLLFGIGYSLRQVIMLNPEVNWLQRLIREKGGSLVMPGATSDERPPKLLGPMVTMMGERTGRIRSIPYEIQLPQLPTTASFFDQQAKHPDAAG